VFTDFLPVTFHLDKKPVTRQLAKVLSIRFMRQVAAAIGPVES
jgi:hypothetical protein